VQAREENVLKISITESPTEARWVLEGRLVGSWVDELTAIWNMAIRTHKGRMCIVELNDVTFIDDRAGRLLRAMSREGARFIANGLYIKHALEELKISSKCKLSRIIGCFLSALLSVIASSPSTRLTSEAGTMNAKRDAWTRVNTKQEARAPNSPTPLFKRMENQDYASSFTKPDR
jgi:hypothetical protein